MTSFRLRSHLPLMYLLFTAVVSLLISPPAWGWGRDGHRNICHEALDLLKQMGGAGNPLQACVLKNIDFFTLAGSSPDEHMKLGMSEGGLIRRLQIAKRWSNPDNRGQMTPEDQAEGAKTFAAYDLKAQIDDIDKKNPNRQGVNTREHLDELKKTLACYDKTPESGVERAACDTLKEKNPSLDDRLALLCKKKAADSTEHHNHFLQLDFMIPGLLAKLDDENPTAIEDYAVQASNLQEEDLDFSKAYPKRNAGIKNNFKYVNDHVPEDMKVDPSLTRDQIAQLKKEGKKLPMVPMKTDALKDPNKISLSEVERQGTADYRVYQLYGMALDALGKIKKDSPDNSANLRKAFYYLGILCHYEGDKGQPFHASGATYDGQSLPPTKTADGKPVPGAAGVHHAFEEGILEETASENGQKPGQHALWEIPSVHESVQKAAKEYLKASDEQGGIKPLTRLEVLTENVRQVASGFKYVDPVQHAFVDAKMKVGETDALPGPDEEGEAGGASGSAKNHAHGESKSGNKRKTEADLERTFKSLTITVKGRGSMTVMDAANERMGRAAGLLARMYKSAIDEAVKSNADLGATLGADCDSYPYTAKYAIENYPPHDYIEKVAQQIGEPSPGKYKVDVAACSSGIAPNFPAHPAEAPRQPAAEVHSEDPNAPTHPVRPGGR